MIDVGENQFGRNAEKTFMRIMRLIVRSTLFLSLFLGLLCAATLWSISLNALSLTSYVRLWQEYNVAQDTKMSLEELTRAGKALLDYLEGKTLTPDIQVNIDGGIRALYNEKELTHLIDVRHLFAAGMLWRNVSTAVTAFSLLGLLVMVHKSLIQRKDGLSLLGRVFILSGLTPLALTMALAIPATRDFTSFWRSFHLLAFTNDLWLLDPAKDWLIKMFPEGVFFSMVKAIGLNLGVFSLAYSLIGLSIILLVRHMAPDHSH